MSDSFPFEENQLLLEFSAYLCRVAGSDDPVLAAAAKLALGAVQAGHNCCDLDACGIIGRKVKNLACSNVIADIPEKNTLLVREDNLLYLNKYAVFEDITARRIAGLLKAPAPAEIDVEMILNLQSGGRRFAPEQITACQKWLGNNFAVVTGGAGTGKTTIAAAAVALEFCRNPKCVIKVVTPTGKARSRFLESLNEELNFLNIPAEIKEKIQNIGCSTIEKTIGIGRNNVKPLYNRDNPLAADLLVIDETSMGSAIRIAQLFEALPESCRIVMLGDANQLFSVEAGSIFAEICSVKELSGCIAVLEENFRSKNNYHLVKAAGAVCADIPAKDKFDIVVGEAEESSSTLPGLSGEYSFIDTAAVKGKKLSDIIAEVLHKWKIVPPAKKEEALDFLENFKILTPVWSGNAGVTACNELMENLFDIHHGDNGYPVMITENDAASGLANGDCGVFWDNKVYFPAPPGVEPLEFVPSELPPWVCAWSMTIHKSQGSGFKKVLVLLPDYSEKILCCELFYTALTRAKKDICIIASSAQLKTTLAKKCSRFSGLALKIRKNIK